VKNELGLNSTEAAPLQLLAALLATACDCDCGCCLRVCDCCGSSAAVAAAAAAVVATIKPPCLLLLLLRRLPSPNASACDGDEGRGAGSCAGGASRPERPHMIKKLTGSVAGHLQRAHAAARENKRESFCPQRHISQAVLAVRMKGLKLFLA